MGAIEDGVPSPARERKPVTLTSTRETRETGALGSR